MHLLWICYGMTVDLLWICYGFAMDFTAFQIYGIFIGLLFITCTHTPSHSTSETQIFKDMRRHESTPKTLLEGNWPAKYNGSITDCHV